MQTPPPKDARSPREVRIQLNKMDRWCQKNARQLGPAAVRLRGLFEVAYTAEHADYLAGEIRALAPSQTS